MMGRINFSLWHLLLLIVIISISLTLCSSMLAGYRVNKQALIANTLETNRVYALKLASTVDDFLKNTLQTLQVSAQEVSPFMKDTRKLLNETNRLKTQTDTFNSVIITDNKGKILAVSPQTSGVQGKTLTSLGGIHALKEKKPLISKPYTGITGKLIVFISYPIHDKQGNYLGLVGGTLYLKEGSALNTLLGHHFYQDGSYVYIVDAEGRIIYHQKPERVNTIVTRNAVVQKLLHKKSGAERVINTKGEDMLTGYAFVPTAHWGVVSQRPTKMALVPSHSMIKEMIVTALPPLVLSIIIILWLVKSIVKPLQQLSYYAERSIDKGQKEHVDTISAWYYEAFQLKKALTYSLNSLHKEIDHFMQESTIDPLTGLSNRRTLDKQIKEWEKNKLPCSIILLDIDYFKRINDTYGHTVGDNVLKFLADHIQKATRKQDICCRIGGEEFVILLPYAKANEAFQLAERLRKNIEQKSSPCGEIVTISAGVASYPNSVSDISQLIEKADQSLYEAKKRGRNCTIVHVS